MNESYKKRLIELAKEIVAADKEEVFVGSEEDAKARAKIKELIYRSKVNFLLGYIMALDNTVETDENGHDLQCNIGIGMACDCWRSKQAVKQNEMPKGSKV